MRGNRYALPAQHLQASTPGTGQQDRLRMQRGRSDTGSAVYAQGGRETSHIPAVESGVFLLRKATAEALRAGAPAAPPPVPEPAPRPVVTPGPEPSPAPGPRPPISADTRTLRITGSVPPEIWNRLGTKILPKLRAGIELKIDVEFSVTVSADTAGALVGELRQVLQELGRPSRVAC
jgi:hypothetical protein